MQIRKLKLTTSVLMLIFLGNGGLTLPYVLETDKLPTEEDYSTVIRFGDGFAAATCKGRVDWVSNAGKITKSENLTDFKLKSLLVADQHIIAAGDHGSMWIGSENEPFKQIDSGTNQNIASLAIFKGQIIAAADGGEIWVGKVGDSFKKNQIQLNGEIISISANTTDCYGVTDKAEILHTRDGTQWQVFDFNKTYDGFYQTCQFSKVLVADKQITILGQQEDGRPVMFYSSGGTVWSQRNLVFIDTDGMPSVLNDPLNDLYYDGEKDLFILIGNHGKMMILPACSHCNKLFEISSANLKGIAGNDNYLIVVGENGFLTTEPIVNY